MRGNSPGREIPRRPIDNDGMIDIEERDEDLGPDLTLAQSSMPAAMYRDGRRVMLRA